MSPKYLRLFTFFFFFLLWVDNFKWPVFNFVDSSAWSSLLWAPLVYFFSFRSSRVSVFYSFCLFLVLWLCSCFVGLVSLSRLCSCACHWASLILTLNSSGNSEITISLEFVSGYLFFSSHGPCFFVSLCAFWVFAAFYAFKKLAFSSIYTDCLMGGKTCTISLVRDSGGVWNLLGSMWRVWAWVRNLLFREFCQFFFRGSLSPAPSVVSAVLLVLWSCTRKPPHSPLFSLALGIQSTPASFQHPK